MFASRPDVRDESDNHLPHMNLKRARSPNCTRRCRFGAAAFDRERHAVMSEFNTWTQIVGSLSGEPGVGLSSQPSSRRSRPGCSGTPRESDGRSSIVALELSDDRTLIICWSDATRGRYAYQRWVIGTSRGKGCCALSGCAIRRGDQVYRPQWRGGYCPANSREMILAAAVGCAGMRVAEEEWLSER
jgi:hypothetical protein